MCRHLALCFLLTALRAGAADTAPDWAREAASRTLPDYPAQVHVATLVDDMHVTVQPDGSTVNQVRSAVRIISREGEARAVAFLPYYRKVTKIRSLQAWLLGPDGSVKAYGKNDVVDVALKQEFELYADERARIIKPQNPPAGSTFAWSAEFEDQPLLPQIDWYFQHREPAMMSRLVLTLPPGWQAQAVTFNHEPVQPQVEGTTYTWQLADLKHIKEEKNSPHADSLAPWLGVTYFPQSGANPVRDWKELGLWQCKLAQGQDDPDDKLAAAVHGLIASRPNVLDRIRALASVVQKFPYVAIDLNLARGGGYKPHAAAQVFEKQYGDCKDKANLLHTMLRQAGIPSYLVVLYSGDRNHVRPEWPSPGQFNHMIVAVQVPDDVRLPAVMVHPALGRLLIFDATDPFTPIGLLPADEQSSYALLLAGEKSGLIQLPVAPPETNRTDVAVEGTLAPDGALQAKLSMVSRAEEATELRGLQHYQQADFSKTIEAWLASNVKQIEADPIETADAFDIGEMTVKVSFKAARYAQIMQGRILVFKPSIVEPYQGFPVQSERRAHPLVLDSKCYHKQVRIQLPDGFKIDEMPDPAKFDSSFGNYSATYKVDGNTLLFTEELDVIAGTFPASAYPEARQFFGKVTGAERTPVVLVKN
ncbi:MAG: DUF3857 and transglutaminase domain-containing protein [Acidobacteriaceae bacterium]|nr:DUF3857 and transglutaminase domain-containing protein [Acidobacteriaceae bacterium]